MQSLPSGPAADDLPEIEEEDAGLRTPPIPPLSSPKGPSTGPSNLPLSSFNPEPVLVHFTIPRPEWPRWLSSRIHSAFQWQCCEFVERRNALSRVKAEKGEQGPKDGESMTMTASKKRRRTSRPSVTRFIWRQKWICVHSRSAAASIRTKEAVQATCPARFEAILGGDGQDEVHVVWAFDHANHPADEQVPLALAIEEGKAIAQAEAAACSIDRLAALPAEVMRHLTTAGVKMEGKRRKEDDVDITQKGGGEGNNDGIKDGSDRSSERTRIPMPLRDYMRNAIRRGETFAAFQDDLAKGGLACIGYLGWEARLSRGDFHNAVQAVRSKRKEQGVDVTLKEAEAGMDLKSRIKADWPAQVQPPVELLQRSIALVKAVSAGQKLDDGELGRKRKTEKRPTRLQNLTKLCDELDGCNELFQAVVQRYEEAPSGDARFAKYRAAEARATETLSDLIETVVTFREKLKEALLKKQQDEEHGSASAEASSPLPHPHAYSHHNENRSPLASTIPHVAPQ